MIKNPPAMQEMRGQSLSRQDPLEKEMATHSSTLAWEILWTAEPGGLQSLGSQKESETTEQLNNNRSGGVSSIFCSVLVISFWRRQWPPTPVLLPGKSHGWRSWWATGKNTGVGCHFLLQGIFPTQGLNPGLSHCRFFTV